MLTVCREQSEEPKERMGGLKQRNRESGFNRPCPCVQCSAVQSRHKAQRVNELGGA